ncbi:hypothetical protein GCM10010381_62160 [Streptomyces xantholiticus]|nr:hypothetical protein GCM10010381_62160 [Streptomyces xantholiticus]
MLETVYWDAGTGGSCPDCSRAALSRPCSSRTGARGRGRQPRDVCPDTGPARPPVRLVPRTGDDLHPLAFTATISELLAHLRRSLTWDQGNEPASHHLFSTATNTRPTSVILPAHGSADRAEREHERPAAPVPPGTSASRYSRQDLDAAAELNSRPRKTPDGETPAERLSKLLTATRR